MDMFSPYYNLAKQLLRFRISRLRLKQSTGLFYSNILAVLWAVFVSKLWINQDSRKLSDKRFYRPTFRMHLTNKEILDKLLSYSEDLKHHYNLYQLLLFHFQNKELEKFFGLSLKHF